MGGRAAIYARISSDPEGKSLGVDRQHSECAKLAERLGLTVVKTFVDNDVSAAGFSRRGRPQYEAMLTAAEEDRFDALISRRRG